MFDYLEDAWAMTKTKAGVFQIRKVFVRRGKLYLQMSPTTYVEVLDDTRTSNPGVLIVERDWSSAVKTSTDTLGRLRVTVRDASSAAA